MPALDQSTPRAIGREQLPADSPHRDSASSYAARRVVDALFGPPSARTFAVRYWDGTVERVASDSPFMLDIAHPWSLRRMLLPPTELSIVEAYLYGDVDIVGDIEAAATMGDVAARRVGSIGAMRRLLRDVLALPAAPRDVARDDGHVARRLLRFGRQHTVGRDAHAVRFHYDVGNDFYALWLDRQMVYSCAYFEHADTSLDAAQEAKLDYICRKLRLRAGERLLDIGCGWGALAVHAARHYGAHVTGITLSEEQASFARARVAREGLIDRVSIETRDYRELDDTALSRGFDKISSVGMVEHVGAQRLGEYFAIAYRLLAPGGLFLNHGIVSVSDARPRSLLDPLWRTLWKRDQFIRRYVFPDGDLVTAATVIASAEAQGFELRDVESLREHYVRTLRHWVRRLERHEADARVSVGDVTYRVWRLYMAASAYGFRSGRISIIQSLLAKPDATGDAHLPATRTDHYSAP